jgi:hypothetical protein
MTTPLTKVERERINDSVLKIQSVRANLDNVGENKIEDLDDIKNCLETADDNLRSALKTPHRKDV